MYFCCAIHAGFGYMKTQLSLIWVIPVPTHFWTIYFKILNPMFSWTLRSSAKGSRLVIRSIQEPGGIHIFRHRWEVLIVWISYYYERQEASKKTGVTLHQTPKVETFSKVLNIIRKFTSWMSVAASEAHPPLIRAAVYLQLIQVCKGTSTANKRIGWHFPLTPSYFPLLLAFSLDWLNNIIFLMVINHNTYIEPMISLQFPLCPQFWKPCPQFWKSEEGCQKWPILTT